MQNKEAGISIIGVLFLAVILIVVLGYFKVSIQSVVESPGAQGNLSYITTAVSKIYNDYLKAPVSYIWNDVIINIFWKSFINNMERIRDGKPTDFDTASPQIIINP